jgi:hypothetical protein
VHIAHKTYAGLRPALAAHLLADHEAQIAQNCNFSRGDLRSFRAPSLEQPLALGTIQSILQYEENGNIHWVESANDIDAIKNPVANDAYERLFFTGETEMRFFANDNISSPFDAATDYYKAGIPAPTAAPTVARVGGAGADYRAYFYIYVNAYGDVGANSALGSISDYSSGRMTVADIVSAPAGRAIDRIWVYRTNASGSEVGLFQFVCEAMFFDAAASYSQGDFVVYSGALYECTNAGGHSGAWNAANFTAGEAVADADLGAVFAYETYLPPPDGLKGLIVIANDICAGFYGNTLYISVPGKPYAYPVAYRKSFDYDIVGIAGYGSNIIVCTTGIPYRVFGQHSASMAVVPYSDFLPCSAKRTISTWQNAVYYSSTNGMARVNNTEALLISAEQPDAPPIIDKDSWQDTYVPTHGCFYQDLYFAFSASISFYIDFQRRFCVTLSPIAQAGYVSEQDGHFYLAIDQGGTLYAQKWEGDSTNYLPFTWRSKLHLFDYKLNVAAGFLELDGDFYDTVSALIDLSTLNAVLFAGDIEGSVRDNTLRDVGLRGDALYALSGFKINANVSYKLYVNGALKHTFVSSSALSLFSFPAGYLTQKIELEIYGYVPVMRDAVATSFEEIMGIVGNR